MNKKQVSEEQLKVMSSMVGKAPFVSLAYCVGLGVNVFRDRLDKGRKYKDDTSKGKKVDKPKDQSDEIYNYFISGLHNVGQEFYNRHAELARLGNEKLLLSFIDRIEKLQNKYLLKDENLTAIDEIKVTFVKSD